MRLAARSCAPFASARRSQLWLRSFGTQSLHARPRSIVLKACLGREPEQAASPSSTETLWGTRIPPFSPFKVPRALNGQGQARFFRKANYIEKIGDNEKTEQILETLEVKDDERDDRPQRRVLDGEGEKTAPPQKQIEKWSENMTQGR